jgi:hypothetical protein
MRPRRGFPIARAFLLASLALAGCDPFHRQQVLKTPPLLEDDVDEAADVSNLSPETKGFFKRDRSTGTWSSEAQEIEKHFGATDF